ncbi:hypothetical protein Tco_0298790 [Tanacetum coccineum]
MELSRPHIWCLRVDKLQPLCGGGWLLLTREYHSLTVTRLVGMYSEVVVGGSRGDGNAAMSLNLCSVKAMGKLMRDGNLAPNSNDSGGWMFKGSVPSGEKGKTRLIKQVHTIVESAELSVSDPPHHLLLTISRHPRWNCCHHHLIQLPQIKG